MDKYKKLVSNTAILSLGTLASKVLVYLLLPLYTECLSPSEYSTADLISQTANLFLPILAVGMVDGIFRFAIDSEKDGYGCEKVFFVSTLFISIGACVSFALVPLFGASGFFSGYEYLIPLYIVASNFHSSAAHFLRGRGESRLFSVQGIICTAITIALNILFLVVFEMGVTGYVLSVILSDAVMTVFLYIHSKLWRYIKPSNFDRGLAVKMIKYSVPMIPTTIFWWVTNVADRYMIAAFIGDDVNGLYAAAFKVPTLLILVSGIFSEAWQFSAVTDGEGEDKENFFSRVFDSFQSIVFLCASFLILLSKFFTEFMLADAYSEAWRYIPLLTAATIFSSMVTFMSSVYVKNKKSVNSFVTAMIGAVSNVAMNALFIPKYGAQGAAAATLLCYVIVYVIRAIDTQRYIRFNTKPITVIINSLLVGVQCAAMLFELKYWYLVGMACFAFVGILNMRPLVASVKTVLGSFFSKIKKKI